MSDSLAEFFETAAGYVAKLAAVEHAYILDDREELDYMLSGIDPIDARQCANQLHALAAGLRGVTDNAVSPSVSPTAASGPSPSVAPALLGGAQASAPVNPRKPW